MVSFFSVNFGMYVIIERLVYAQHEELGGRGRKKERDRERQRERYRETGRRRIRFGGIKT